MLKNFKYFKKKSVIELTIFLSAAVLVFPQLAHAQEGVSALITSLGNIVNQLIPLVASLSLLAFFWGLAKYIFNAGSDEGQQQGKRIMIGGIVALFLVASVGGIIEFMATALDIETGGSITPPTINIQSGDGIDDLEMVYNGGDGTG
ncbi:MAG: hypothetical protein WD335_02645 [Candidatus Paceibacterota bacterium]